MLAPILTANYSIGREATGPAAASYWAGGLVVKNN